MNFGSKYMQYLVYCIMYNLLGFCEQLFSWEKIFLRLSSGHASSAKYINNTRIREIYLLKKVFFYKLIWDIE